MLVCDTFKTYHTYDIIRNTRRFSFMKWFKEVFLPSFEDCKGKRISEKQGMIFEKYLDFDYSNDNAEYFIKIINGKKIKLQKSRNFLIFCNTNLTSKHIGFQKINIRLKHHHIF